jgi:hypothetical protein
MALSEDLSVFLNDFGVSVTAGAISGVGVLDMPGQVLAGGMVLSTDYTLTCKAADFGGLFYGDGITVNGISYQVREVRKLDDGAFCEITLSKLDPDVTAPGGKPRAFVFVFEQPTPATTWVINHNFGYEPSVEVIDSTGAEVEAAVTNPSINQTVVTFSVATAGIARLF